MLRPRGRAVVGIGDPEAMAGLPFTSYGFTLRPVADVTAALQKTGFDVVEQRRLDDVGIPHLLLAARCAD